MRSNERTTRKYNLEIFDKDLANGKYQIPIINNDNYVPKDLIGYNYANTNNNYNCGIHFYLDDYQFERALNLWYNYKQKR